MKFLSTFHYFKLLIKNLIICSKPNLSLMVVITYTIGLFLALPPPAQNQPFNMLFYIFSIVGLVFLVGGANTFNCCLEKDVDAYMSRTKSRPLVTGHMTLKEAFWGAFFLSVAGLFILYKFTNNLTFTLGLLAHLSYVLFYTPLKRQSTLSLFVGAIPGALPPMMGWTAIQNNMGLTGWLLFWILFLWQLPHFISIAIYRREDYLRAGLKTLPQKIGVEPAKLHMFLYSLLLVSVSFLPYFLNVAGIFYLSSAILVGAGFVWFAWESLSEVENLNSSVAIRRVFFASLVYLPATLGVWAAEGFLRNF